MIENNSDWHLQEVFETEPRQGCELLFRKYYEPLCSHAIRFVYAKETAEDIVSEVFLNFWKNQAYHSVTTSFQAYLFRAVRYRAYNYMRWEMSKSRRSVDAQEANLADHSPSPAEVIQYDELHRKVEQAIETLPPQCKRVFLLSRFEGKRYQEIADELDIGLKTVETHVSKALTLLRTTLKDEWTLAVLWLLSQ